jgi:hypothetical protein
MNSSRPVLTFKFQVVPAEFMEWEMKPLSADVRKKGFVKSVTSRLQEDGWVIKFNNDIASGAAPEVYSGDDTLLIPASGGGSIMLATIVLKQHLTSHVAENDRSMCLEGGTATIAFDKVDATSGINTKNKQGMHVLQIAPTCFFSTSQILAKQAHQALLDAEYKRIVESNKRLKRKTGGMYTITDRGDSRFDIHQDDVFNLRSFDLPGDCKMDQKAFNKCKRFEGCCEGLNCRACTATPTSQPTKLSEHTIALPMFLHQGATSNQLWSSLKSTFATPEPTSVPTSAPTTFDALLESAALNAIKVYATAKLRPSSAPTPGPTKWQHQPVASDGSSALASLLGLTPAPTPYPTQTPTLPTTFSPSACPTAMPSWWPQNMKEYNVANKFFRRSGLSKKNASDHAHILVASTDPALKKGLWQMYKDETGEDDAAKVMQDLKDKTVAVSPTKNTYIPDVSQPLASARIQEDFQASDTGADFIVKPNETLLAQALADPVSFAKLFLKDKTGGKPDASRSVSPTKSQGLASANIQQDFQPSDTGADLVTQALADPVSFAKHPGQFLTDKAAAKPDASRSVSPTKRTYIPDANELQPSDTGADFVVKPNQTLLAQALANSVSFATRFHLKKITPFKEIGSGSPTGSPTEYPTRTQHPNLEPTIFKAHLHERAIQKHHTKMRHHTKPLPQDESCDNLHTRMQSQHPNVPQAAAVWKCKADCAQSGNCDITSRRNPTLCYCGSLPTVSPTIRPTRGASLPTVSPTMRPTRSVWGDYVVHKEFGSISRPGEMESDGTGRFPTRRPTTAAWANHLNAELQKAALAKVQQEEDYELPPTPTPGLGRSTPTPEPTMATWALTSFLKGLRGQPTDALPPTSTPGLGRSTPTPAQSVP